MDRIYKLGQVVCVIVGLLFFIAGCTEINNLPERSIQLSVTPNEEVLKPQQTVIISVISEEWKQSKLEWSIKSDELKAVGELTSYTEPTVVYKAPSQGSGKIVISLSGSANNITGTASISFTIAPSTSIAVLPDQFIRDYYAAINDRQYEKAWSMLSDDFKKKNHCCDEAGDYKFVEYTDFWDTIEQVHVQSTEIKDQNDQTASVLANLQYVKNGKAGKVLPTYFELVSTPDKSSWIIAQVHY